MKKRLISLLMCLVLCMSLLPMAALAEDIEPLAVAEGEAMPDPTAEPEPTVESEPTAEPEVTAEPTAIPEATSTPEPIATPEVTAEPEVTPEPTTAPEPTATAEPERTISLDGETSEEKVARVQALIDALPDVTSENKDLAKQKLDEVYEAMEELTAEEFARLNKARYQYVLEELLRPGPPGSENGFTNLTQAMFNKQSNDYVSYDSGTQLYKLAIGYYNLGEDITISDTLWMPYKTTLDLNGHTLTVTGDKPALLVRSELTISGSGLINGDEGPGIVVDTRGKVIMEGGTLAGFLTTNSQTPGAAVNVTDGGVFEMTGGTICYSSSYCANGAGAVYVANGGRFVMRGGTISGCVAFTGGAGAVYVSSDGDFEMRGGTIEHCRGKADNTGGAVVVESGENDFNMFGGTITDCWTTGSNSAGGVLAKGRFNMLPSAKIVNCDSGVAATASAGGVYAASTATLSGTLTLTNCQSKCGGSAGGIYVAGGTHSLDVNITNCKGCLNSESTCVNKGSAAAIYLADNANVTMSGTISRCVYEYDRKGTAPVSGGVYVSSGTTFTMNSGSKIEFCRVECTYNEAPEQVSSGVYNEGAFTTSGAVTGCNIWYRNGTELKMDSRVSAGIMNCGNLTLKSGASIRYSSAVPMTVDGNEYVLIPNAQRSLDLVNGYKTSNNTFASNCNVTPESGMVDVLVNYGTIGETTSAAPTKFFSGTNYGVIQAADFYSSSGKLDNYGTISGGTYACKVECSDGSYVTGGDFEGATRTASGRPRKITFDLNGGTGDGTATQWRWNAAVTKPGQDPQKAHYNFAAWSTSNEKNYTAFGFGEKRLASDITLYARWNPAPTASVTTPPRAKSLTYNGTAQELVVAGIANGGTMKYSLIQNGTYTTTIPTKTDAGIYSVYYMVAADDKHSDSAIAGPIAVTVAKKSVTVSGITAENKTYDGNTTATLKYDVATIGGKVDGDDLSVTATGTFVDKNVGNGKTVNVTGLALGGTAKDNYFLVATGNQTSTTANITAKEVMVTGGITAEDKIYDGNTTATLDCTGATIGGNVDGDDLTVTATGAFVDGNVGNGKTVNISNLTLDGTAKGNYALAENGHQMSTAADITAKPVTPTLEIAEGPYTYNGVAQEPAVTLKDGDVTIPASEYTVSYSDNVNVGTATVMVADKEGGNYSFTSVTGANTFEIEARPVTLKSADGEKEYNGEALKAETVTATGMAGGEEFDYDFTGSRTDIGASENAFVAKNSATATLTNYQITPVFGTLRVTVPTGIGDGTEDMTVDTVTSDDRKTIEDTLKTVDDYLGMEPTKDEATELNELKDKLSDLLDRLDEAKNAAGDKSITDTDDITKDNAKPSDKKKLEDAKDAIEKALEDFGANLTEEEKQALNDKLARINAALDAIAAAEAAAKAVKTGDEAMPILWLALALSAALALGFAARKRKN